jgi:site-specific recombinase XerD
MMVQIIRKAALPLATDLPERLRRAAEAAVAIALRAPRPVGFPLLFSAHFVLIEPAVAFLHEHAVERAHTSDTVRTYAEILYDWFDTLEQNGIRWEEADAVDLVRYRNRMMTQPSPQTHRPYSVRTVNHRVRGVLRFYAWAVRAGWLKGSPLVGRSRDFQVARGAQRLRNGAGGSDDQALFVLRQFEALPRPLSPLQARELLAALPPPYDLMARWQLYTGLRVSELLRLTVTDVARPAASRSAFRLIDVRRKGGKPGYVIAAATLLEESVAYLRDHRRAWVVRRARRTGRDERADRLFLNSCGRCVSKNRYQQVIHSTGRTAGFTATTHLLRATFACTMLARLEQLAKQGASINPLLIVKILMGHEHLETTDRYLRAVAIDVCALGEVLDSLLGEPA